MNKIERSQTDDKFDAVSQATGIASTGEPDDDLTRQEFKDDLDLKTIIMRHGGPPELNAPTFGEIDFDVDLAGAFRQIDMAQRAYAELPPEIQKKYPSTQAIIVGLANGQLANDIEQANKPKPPATTLEPAKPATT